MEDKSFICFHTNFHDFFNKKKNSAYNFCKSLHHLILTFEVEFVFLVAVVIVANYTQCGKFFAKSFNLKVHKQNVHEIEKISTKSHAYESINDIMESTILKSAY